MPLPRQEVDATTPEISARQIRDRRGRRDHLHPRLGHDDAGARHLGGAQCDPRCRAQGRATSTACSTIRAATSTSATFIAGDLGMPAQFLHGRVRRRLVDRGAGRHRDRHHRGRAVQDRGDLPLDERLSQVRIGGTGARSAAPVAGDMLHNRAYGWQSAGQSFAPDLHAPHVRLRHHARAGRACEDVPHRATPRTTPRPITRSALRSRT